MFGQVDIADATAVLVAAMVGERYAVVLRCHGDGPGATAIVPSRTHVARTQSGQDQARHGAHSEAVVRDTSLM